MAFFPFTCRIAFTLFPIAIISIPFLRKIYFLEDKLLAIKGKPPVSSAQKRDLFFDVIKGISILAVILIHTQYLYMHNFSENLSEKESFLFIFISNLGRFTIPIFLVSSGALLSYGKNETFLNFFRKRTLKIIIPFLAVSALLLIIQKVPLSDWFFKIITGEVSLPFYFAIVLIQLYLLYPFILKMMRYKWFLYASFLFSFLTYATVFLFNLDIFGMGSFAPCFFGRFLFFFVFGIYAKEYYLSNSQKFSVGEIIFWSLMVFIFIMEALLLQEVLYNARFLYGLGVLNLFFMLKNKLFGKINPLTKILSRFGKLSLWIFLLHFQLEEFILNIIVNFSNNVYLNFLFVFFVTTIATFVLASICDFFYKKITQE